MSEVFLRRLTPSFMPLVRSQLDFRIISIHRPVSELLEILMSQSFDGLITEWLEGITDEILTVGLPAVIVDTDEQYEGAVSIDVDDWAVGREAAEAFLSSGYRSLACVTNRTPYGIQREEGFRKVVSGAPNFDTYEVTAFAKTRYSEQFAGRDEGLNAWLSNLPKPVGIFAVHDPLGRYLCSVCESLGLRVPEEVAIIGANNDELVCGLSFPMLSSVVIPWHSIGLAAGNAISNLLMGNPPPDEVELIRPGAVVFRHSANYLAVSDPLLRKVMSYFQNHLAEALTIGEVCATLGCSRRALERSFREYYHMSPWEMFSRLRVQHAKKYLTQTNHSVAMISSLCGFNDPERMAVVFKRIEKTTPSKFRQARKIEEN